MRKTDFSFLPQNKKIIYEQMARIYREQAPFRNVVWTPFQKKLVNSTIVLISVAGEGGYQCSVSDREAGSFAERGLCR